MLLPSYAPQERSLLSDARWMCRAGMTIGCGATLRLVLEEWAEVELRKIGCKTGVESLTFAESARYLFVHGGIDSTTRERLVQTHGACNEYALGREYDPLRLQLLVNLTGLLVQPRS